MATIDFSDCQKAIAQIYRVNSDNIVGTGFWVGDRYLMTCAHVVQSALSGLALPVGSDMRGHYVSVLFSEANQSNRVEAEVIYFKFDPREGHEDVAVLKLQEAFDPQGGQAIELDAHIQSMRRAEVKTFGYVYGNSLGRQVTAMTNGPVQRWVQLESSKDIGIPIREGLSGSPVWCSKSQRFIGIVVARDTLCPEDRVGFMIPAGQLITPCRFVQREKLKDILLPYEKRLAGLLSESLRLCRSESALGRVPIGLDNILKDLAEQGSGADNGPSKLVQFVAGLLNLLPSGDDELTATLTQWALPLTADLDALRESMRTRLHEQKSQQVEVLNPLLIVSIQSESEAGDPPYFVQAWLIENSKLYDATTDKGARPLWSRDVEKALNEASDQGPRNEQGFSYEEIALLLESYLEQVGEKISLADLTIELFVPFALLNQPIERLGIPSFGLMEPLGIDDPDRPQVLLRSQNRLDFRRGYQAWLRRWENVEDNHLNPASALFVNSDRDLRNNLKDKGVVGLKLARSPIATDQGQVARLIIAGVPIALWIRDNSCDENWLQRLETEILDGSLQDVLERVWALRRETPTLETDAEYLQSANLGHHLAILWENPNHIPPKEDQFSAVNL